MQVESRGHRINYLSAGGEGTTFLLLHGNMQAAQDWWDNRYVDQLGVGNRVIAVDLLGFGESDKPHDAASYSLDDYVVDLLAVLDAEGVDQAVVWGYSLGVFTAEAFAKQHPERTTAYVAGGNMVGLTPTDRRNIALAGADEVEAHGVRKHIDSWGFLRPETIDLFERRNDPLAVAAAVRGTTREHAAEETPLPGRTFNYAGSGERWFAVMEAVAAEKGVAFAAVEGSDHSEAFRRADVVVPMVLDFLRN